MVSKLTGALIVLGVLAACAFFASDMLGAPAMAALTKRGNTTPDPNVPKIGRIIPDSDLAGWCVPRRHTVIVFTAKWCPGCQSLEQGLKMLTDTRGDVVVRKVSMDQRDQWQQIARSAGQDIASVPHVVIYSAEGKLVAADHGDTKTGLHLLTDWINSEIQHTTAQ
jgi:hypothetical protein